MKRIKSCDDDRRADRKFDPLHWMAITLSFFPLWLDKEAEEEE
jgi:hypothetical protein